MVHKLGVDGLTTRDTERGANCNNGRKNAKEKKELAESTSESRTLVDNPIFRVL